MSTVTLRPVLLMGSVRLPFPSPDMDADAVRDLYSGSYPHLAHATLGEPYAEAGDLVYPIQKPPATTKG